MLEHDARAYARASLEHDAPAYATDGRTDGLTQKDLRNAESFSSASRAGGLRDFAVSAAIAEVLLAEPERAEVIRSGERDPISRMVRQLIYRRDRWRCQMCGAAPFAADPSRRSGALHLDHIQPWSNGGSDRSDNLRTLCGPCNMERSNYVHPSRDVPSMPIVRICLPCLCMDGSEKPPDAFEVYCGSRHHIAWALPGWQIL